MLCKRPYVRDRYGTVFRRPDLVVSGQADWTDGTPFPCGQCLPCRINRRRVWTCRLVLESYCHAKACFVTLTYSDDNLAYNPLDNRLPTLCKRDAQLFLKRLRRRFEHRTIRYYLCGEYGAKTQRPHYHAIVFGVAPEELDETFLVYNGSSPHSTLHTLWNMGRVHVGECSRHTIQYVAGYVTKKFTKKGDGFQKEFSLMSLKPGIGANALTAIEETVNDYSHHTDNQRVGTVIRFEGKVWPLGRYLSGKIAERCGLEDGLGSYVTECRALFAEARRKGLGLVEYLAERDESRIHSLETRQKIFNQRDGV